MGFTPKHVNLSSNRTEMLLVSSIILLRSSRCVRTARQSVTGPPAISLAARPYGLVQKDQTFNMVDEFQLVKQPKNNVVAKKHTVNQDYRFKGKACSIYFWK